MAPKRQRQRQTKTETKREKFDDPMLMAIILMWNEIQSSVHTYYVYIY